jgi:hypothetical protein
MKSFLYKAGAYERIVSGELPDFNVFTLERKGNVDLDDLLESYVVENLNLEEYKHIFIPLTFGQANIDFLGLRLATHIRCTLGKNQGSSIYLYGVESVESLLDQELFHILSTRNIGLIDYSLKALLKSNSADSIKLSKRAIREELGKLKLNPPMSLYDNHSVANIWGMYRLLSLQGIQPADIKSLNSQIVKLSNIYFKWLVAKSIPDELPPEDVTELRQTYKRELPGLRILGKVDPKLLGKK